MSFLQFGRPPPRPDLMQKATGGGACGLWVNGKSCVRRCSLHDHRLAEPIKVKKHAKAKACISGFGAVEERVPHITKGVKKRKCCIYRAARACQHFCEGNLLHARQSSGAGPVSEFLRGTSIRCPGSAPAGAAGVSGTDRPGLALIGGFGGLSGAGPGTASRGGRLNAAAGKAVQSFPIQGLNRKFRPCHSAVPAA